MLTVVSTPQHLMSSRKRIISKVASKRQEEKANKNKSRLYYTCRIKGQIRIDCLLGNTPKLNLSIDSNLLRPKNDTCAREVIGSPCASTQAIWVPKSIVTNLDGSIFPSLSQTEFWRILRKLSHLLFRLLRCSMDGSQRRSLV